MPHRQLVGGWYNSKIVMLRSYQQIQAEWVRPALDGFSNYSRQLIDVHCAVIRSQEILWVASSLGSDVGSVHRR